ncbi:MAG: NTP transferase domain-containing protein [Dehalococcoidia bacterium]|nr:NTP transferase domain-containing protein [Dehalococcoidia bacterium]
MKGAILAGGLGSRLYPLTYATNKHLLPVFDKPMIYYPLQTLVNAGIDEVIVVTGGPHAGDFIHVLKNGEEFGIRHLEYAYQEGEGGIADALRLCEAFVDGESVAVILGDNCTDFSIRGDVESFHGGARIFLKQVPDPHRFGVPRFDDPQKPSRILRIDEKPANPQSNYAVTGLYLYDAQVFDFIRLNKPSARGEMEITDVNNQYLEKGALGWAILDGFWSDAGTFESLYRTSVYWTRKKLGPAAEALLRDSAQAVTL